MNAKAAIELGEKRKHLPEAESRLGSNAQKIGRVEKNGGRQPFGILLPKISTL